MEKRLRREERIAYIGIENRKKPGRQRLQSLRARIPGFTRQKICEGGKLISLPVVQRVDNVTAGLSLRLSLVILINTLILSFPEKKVEHCRTC